GSEQHALGQLDPLQLLVGGPGEVQQHLVVVQREAVLGGQLGVQFTGQRRVPAQQCDEGRLCLITQYLTAPVSPARMLDIASIPDPRGIMMSTVQETQTLIPAGTWSADRAHSSVQFAVRHMKIVTVHGRFLDFEATLQGGEQPTLKGAIRTASAST